MADSELPRPQANRLRRPSWKDGRLATGVAIMLLATAGSVMTIKHFDDSVEVLQAKHDLVPGEPVKAQDVVAVKVRIDGEKQLYLPASDGNHGRATRAVRAGELIPRSAVASEADSTRRTVAVHVDPAEAANLVKGSIVDVWVALRTSSNGAGSNDYKAPTRQVERAIVSRTPATGSGFNTSREDYVSVLVPQAKVADLISAMNRGGKVTLVPTAGSPVREGDQ